MYSQILYTLDLYDIVLTFLLEKKQENQFFLNEPAALTGKSTSKL